MGLPPSAVSARSRTTINYNQLLPMQAAGLYTPEAPPFPTEEDMIRQAQLSSNLGSSDFQSLVEELGQRRAAAEQQAAAARQEFMGAQQAPMPELQAPNMSPLVAMGSLAAGNMASVLSGRPEWAQAGPNKLNAMQQESLKSAQQAREENLNLLLNDYEKSRAAAQSAGDLETSTKFGEKIKRIHDIQDKAAEGLKELNKAKYDAGETATKEKAANARALLQAKTQLKVQEMQEQGANWRASQTRGAGPSKDEWQKGFQDIAGQYQAEIAGGKSVKEAQAMFQFRLMNYGLPPGNSYEVDKEWLTKAALKKGGPLFDLNNQDQRQVAYAMLAKAHPEEFVAEQAATRAEIEKTQAEEAAYRAKYNEKMAAIREKLLRAPVGLSRGH